ncbi:MAG: NBR1-Ig-like domain-containing protein [Anaerolineaceae bacterium]
MNTKTRISNPIFLLFVILILISLSCSIPAINIQVAPSQTPEGGDESVKTRTPEPDADRTETPTPTTTFTPTPTWTIEPSITVAAPTFTPSVTPLPCNWAQYISDVTIGDGTEITANNNFTKTWRLKNIGSCTWTSGYRLIFDHGDRMGAPDSTVITAGSVPPGSTVDVSVNLKAPADGGTYQGYFKLRSSDNVVFGIGNSASGSFWVQIVSVELVLEPIQPIIPLVVMAPDLYVQSITLNPNPPVQGQPVQVKVAVYNQGNAATGPYNVVWYAGSNFPNQACAWPVDNSNAHGGRVLTCNYPGYSSWYGSLTTRAIVDSGNSVDESNEGNNTLDTNISVSKP